MLFRIDHVHAFSMKTRLTKSCAGIDYPSDYLVGKVVWTVYVSREPALVQCFGYHTPVKILKHQ